MRRLPFGPMEAFVTVARSRSLAEAASTMHLTVPALSRRIAQIEAHLGTRLFQRLPRGLVLTEAGAAYFTALAPAWDGIRDATEAARDRAQRRALRISMIPSFAAHWLVPRLAGLQAGGVAIEIETSPDLVDLTARPDLDGAIRLGAGPWPGLQSDPFLPVDAFPVASAGFLETAAIPYRPLDLLRYRLIGTHHQPAFWREWFAAADGGIAAPEQAQSFDNLQVVYEAAAANMGIALGIDPVVRPFVDTKRLIRLPLPRVRLSRHFHLLRRPDVKPGRDFTAFRTWLLAEAVAFGTSPVPADPVMSRVAGS